GDRARGTLAQAGGHEDPADRLDQLADRNRLLFGHRLSRSSITACVWSATVGAGSSRNYPFREPTIRGDPRSVVDGVSPNRLRYCTENRPACRNPHRMATSVTLVCVGSDTS